MSKQPETTKQFVIPGVPVKEVHFWQRRAEKLDRPLAWVLRKVLTLAHELPLTPEEEGGGGNRTRSSSLHLATA